MGYKRKERPKITDILCDCCKIPLRDFEVMLTIADKIKLCSSCKLKTLKNESKTRSNRVDAKV